MKNNNKSISTFAGIAVGFVVIALFIAFITQTGVNRPPMRFLDIPETTMEYINDLANELKNKTNLSMSSQGPFNWDNDRDLGNRKTVGQWAKEEDNLSVVYYRRDKDAVMQAKAYDYVNKLGNIAADISDMFGKYNYPEDINGRKTAVYLPTTDLEYTNVLQELCGEGKTIPTNKDGCSVIEIGPLGCQLKGIVIHPNTLNSGNPEDVSTVLRRELARYNYFCSSDFDENLSKTNWFTEGLFEHFANDNNLKEPVQVTEDFVKSVISNCNLTSDFPNKNGLSSEAGESFFSYFANKYGEESLTDLITKSYEMDFDQLFEELGIDLEKERQTWLISLTEVFYSNSNESTSSFFDALYDTVVEGIEFVEDVVNYADSTGILGLLVTAVLL